MCNFINFIVLTEAIHSAFAAKLQLTLKIVINPNNEKLLINSSFVDFWQDSLELKRSNIQ